MFNYIWPLMIAISMVAAVINGKVDAVVAGLLVNANRAIDIVVSLVGVMAFWLGLMKIAENAGLVDKLVARLKPLMAPLFPELPEDHPAFGLITVSVVSNMLGLNNASTPVSIRAMQALQKINTHPTVASNAMCLFMVINSSSVQLMPTTAMAVLSKAGAQDPTRIVLTGLIATAVSTLSAVVACLWMQSWGRYSVIALTESKQEAKV